MITVDPIEVKVMREITMWQHVCTSLLLSSRRKAIWSYNSECRDRCIIIANIAKAIFMIINTIAASIVMIKEILHLSMSVIGTAIIMRSKKLP
jgi:hypothetical protein